MQTGVLSGLQLTSMFPELVLDNFYRKTQNSIEAGVMSRCTRNHVAVRRLVLAGVDRVLRLAVEVLEHEVREHRRQLQAAQHAGLHVVRVVAAREVRGRVRRDRQPAVPLALLAAAASGRRARRRRRRRARRQRRLRRRPRRRRCASRRSPRRAPPRPPAPPRPGRAHLRTRSASAAPASAPPHPRTGSTPHRCAAASPSAPAHLGAAAGSAGSRPDWVSYIRIMPLWL